MSRRTARRIVFIVAGVAIGAIATAIWIDQRRNFDTEPPSEKSDVVVLIHGMGRTSTSMAPLAEKLSANGFHISNWDYRSTQGTIEQHGEKLLPVLRALDADPHVSRIHIVTHSLGGIVARYALNVERPEKIGRVVMLAPPNGGSELARQLAPFLGGIIKPLGELSNDSDSIVNKLSVPAGVEIGIIAAESDGKVALADTHLDGETDHVVVPGFHSFIMAREDVAEQTIHFLTHGSFVHGRSSIRPDAKNSMN